MIEREHANERKALSYVIDNRLITLNIEDINLRGINEVSSNSRV